MKTLFAPALATILSLVSLTPAAPIESIPVEEIVPGMVGEGRTVFHGDAIESFKVTILGVLRNFGPNQNMILAELSGGPLAHTGVIAGMSGSPVYVDGKLIGAIAYSFPFAKDPIAGITPIQEMFDKTARPSTRRAGRREPLEFPLTAAGLSDVTPPRPAPVPLQGVSLTGVDLLRPHLGRELAPIATPASLVGFSQESFELVAPLLRQLGVEPLMGGAASVSTGATAQDGERRPLEPGDAIGVGLVTGDLSISATGTVTHVDPVSDDVYAFGHPLFNLGPIEYPMMQSDVHLVLPSLMSSFKMASSGGTIGTWVQDRATAIKGVLGPKPRMIPLRVNVATSLGREQDYSVEIVDDELFSPVLAYATLVAILQSTERQFGSQTVKLSAWIETTSNRKINIEDIFTDQQAAVSASAMVAAPLQFLLSNDFEDVTLREVRVDLEATEVPLSAQLLRAWFASDEVAPGGTVTLNLLLRSYRGDEMLETVKLTIPPYVRSGKLRVMVADADTVSAVERNEAGRGFVPKNMDQLVRAINSLRKNNRLYVRVSRLNSSAAIVAGEYMTALPPSIINVLETDDSGSGFTALGSSTFLEQEVTTEYDVSGSRLLQLEVKKH